ncbi:MAG TPA: hypothetical protein VN650_17935 [Gemmatimonadaceae bacterium]|nr:hypothetical protein [Gemmatimonadaceae bacterium]
MTDGASPIAASSASRASPSRDDANRRDASYTPYSTHRGDALRAALVGLSVSLVCIVAYLVTTVPGAWFPRASARAWNVTNLSLVRGTGRIIDNQLVVSAPDATGITLVSVTSSLSSSDYPGIAWTVADLREDAQVRLLWRSDFNPGKLNSVPISVSSGHAALVLMAKNSEWVGTITGLALAIFGPIAQPILVGPVVAKPMGAIEIVRDRLREWFAFEPWTRASINTITGGADPQAIALPAVVALVVALSGIATFFIRRWRSRTFGVALPGLLAGFFLAGWLVLDARWTWNLLRQEHATAAQYGGKDLRHKHLAGEDAPLFAFIQKALAVMPSTPVRVFIAADADYFRGRAAYHLYPHSVYFNPRDSALPPASAFHPGDWLLVFQRHAIQFDRTQGKIRWEGNQTVNAELKLLEPGAALFVIR